MLSLASRKVELRHYDAMQSKFWLYVTKSDGAIIRFGAVSESPQNGADDDERKVNSEEGRRR